MLYEVITLAIKQEKYTAKPVIPLQETAAIGESARLIINTFLMVARRNDVITSYSIHYTKLYELLARIPRAALRLSLSPTPRIIRPNLELTSRLQKKRKRQSIARQR